MFKFWDEAIVRPVLRFVRDERGATAIEYAMIASGVGVAVAASIVNLGTLVKSLFTSTSALFH
jgi:pilus assembly protein Flp/PilA